MYKVEIFDNKIEESREVMLFNSEELEKMMNHIKLHSDRYDLISIHQEYCCDGFDCFIECSEDKEQNYN